MRFENITARPDWAAQFAAQGLNVDLLASPPYWMEAYSDPFAVIFSAAENENLITATREINALALQLVQEVCFGSQSEALFDLLAIDALHRPALRSSFERRDASLYGRLDLTLFDGQFKLLELNYDNPTSLYESALLQKLWLVQDSHLNSYNRLEELLIERLHNILPMGTTLHLASADGAVEDAENLIYLERLMSANGLSCKRIYMHEIGFDSDGQLLNAQGEGILGLFKIYPWNVLFLDDREILAKRGALIMTEAVKNNQTRFIEPAWKTILSSKAILPLLWRIAPGHANLLPACFDDGKPAAQSMKTVPHVRKPFFGAGGGDVSVIFPDDPAKNEKNPERYSDNLFVLQQYLPLPQFKGHNVVVGSWLVGDQPACISVRADKRLVTGSGSLFVPHIVEA